MEIIRGVIPCAKKVVIYGPEGIGKSTFASKFPDPVFIDTEGSTNSMDVGETSQGVQLADVAGPGGLCPHTSDYVQDTGHRYH